MEPPPGVFTYINLIDLVQMVIVVMLLCCTLKAEPPTLVFAYMNLDRPGEGGNSVDGLGAIT